MAMANGVEVRVPFLDIELAEFASKIPPKFKQKGIVSKWILKKILEKYLPKEIIYRPKTGFGVPLNSWVKSTLSDFIDDLLCRENIDKRGIFDYQSVNNLIAANKKGQIEASFTIFSLVKLKCSNNLIIQPGYFFLRRRSTGSSCIEDINGTFSSFAQTLEDKILSNAKSA